MGCWGFFYQGLNVAVIQFFLFLTLILITEYYSHSITSVDKTWKVEVRDKVRFLVAEDDEKIARLTDVVENKYDAVPWLKLDLIAYFFAFIANCVIICAINFAFIVIISRYGENATIGANFMLGLYLLYSFLKLFFLYYL